MSGCDGTLIVPPAEEFIDEKWTAVEALASQSTFRAYNALSAITSATTNAARDIRNFSGQVDVSELPTSRIYIPPPVPNIIGPRTTIPEPHNIGSPVRPIDFLNPGPVPEFTATPPPGGLPNIQFNEPTAPGEFLDTYTPPEVSAFEYPPSPAPFTALYTPATDPGFVAIKPPAEFTGTVPTPLPKPPIPTLTTRNIGDVPDVVAPVYPDAPIFTFPNDPQRVNIPLPTLRTPDLSGIEELLNSLLAGKPAEPITTLPKDTFLATFNALRGTLGTELSPSLAIEETLTWMLAGNTIGLPADVAQGLRDRAFGAEDRMAFQEEDKAIGEWLARGFTLPGGALDAKLLAVRQENRDKKAEINRDLWLEEAKLEIDQLRFAIEQGINYQGLLWDTKTKLWATCGELANRHLDAQFKMLDAAVTVYQSQISAWQAEASVTREFISAKLQAELSLLEVTKTEAEISGLFVDINRQNVDLYRAQLESVATEVDIYKSQVDAANSQMQGQTLKLEAFAQQVAAYSAAVRAYEAEWSGYAASVSADTAQVEGFRAQVQAYGAQVDAYGTQVNAESTRVSSLVETEKLRLDTFRTRADVYNTTVSAYETQVGAERARIEADVSLAKLPLDAYVARSQAYSAGVDAYGKRVQAETARVQSQVDIYKLPVEVYTAQAQAYASRVNGYSSAVQASATDAQTKISYQKLRLDGWQLDLDVYKALLDARIASARIEVESEDLRLKEYASKIEGEKAHVQSDVERAEQFLRNLQLRVNTDLREMELAQTRIIELAKVSQDGSSEVARVASQLAGAALSAVSASASISQGYSASRSMSCGESYSYDCPCPDDGGYCC